MCILLIPWSCPFILKDVKESKKRVSALYRPQDLVYSTKLNILMFRKFIFIFTWNSLPTILATETLFFCYIEASTTCSHMYLRKRNYRIGNDSWIIKFKSSWSTLNVPQLPVNLRAYEQRNTARNIKNIFAVAKDLYQTNRWSFGNGLDPVL